jgi:hypothetical protein
VSFVVETRIEEVAVQVETSVRLRLVGLFCPGSDRREISGIVKKKLGLYVFGPPPSLVVGPGGDLGIHGARLVAGRVDDAVGESIPGSSESLGADEH